VPVATALAAGFGLATAKFIVTGVQQIAPVAAMFVFAILYFGIITDAGTLEPVINAILRAVGARPARVVVGSALLALLVHLDGSGAVTFLVAVPAMLPLYDRLRIDRRVLACVVSMAAGVNFLPWTGPMIRASASLHIPIAQLFRPLVPVQLVGLVFVFSVAWYLGRRSERDQRRRNSGAERDQNTLGPTSAALSHGRDQQLALRRPRLVWINGLITVTIMAVMIAGTVDPAVMFMIGTALLTINYADPAAQRARIDAHATAALTMAATLLGVSGFTIAVVTGDDIRELAGGDGFSRLAETGKAVNTADIVSANAYLGAEPIAEALQRGADVVITGRVADPSMFLAAIAVHHGWRLDDWTLAGRGTLVGHLLECGGQITGGYFADPGVRDVAGLARLGFPLAEVDADGTAIITKPAGSGGQVTAATCTEQLLYEIHDPSSYLTPDVVADFSRVRITDLGNDRVRIEAADGRRRPDTLKVSVGQFDGWIGEGQISYAGPGAAARGRLAGEIVAERLRLTAVIPLELRTDLIGMDALHGTASPIVEPYEVRLRVAARTKSEADARRVAREVEALFTNGPAGGGGAFTSVRPVLAIRTALVARDRVSCRVDYVRVS
jgi:hypothetical protein